jgi:hypothetical protein
MNVELFICYRRFQTPKDFLGHLEGPKEVSIEYLVYLQTPKFYLYQATRTKSPISSESHPKRIVVAKEQKICCQICPICNKNYF